MEALIVIWAVVLLLIAIMVFGGSQETSSQKLKRYRRQQISPHDRTP
ncbi:MAG TPA: hypothetical protein VGQ81_03990 [Acidobacteriota bacterium]|jgi:hypothetical protein|nr:hypothetical protein [Acidobacteriota bacterium]